MSRLYRPSFLKEHEFAYTILRTEEDFGNFSRQASSRHPVVKLLFKLIGNPPYPLSNGTNVLTLAWQANRYDPEHFWYGIRIDVAPAGTSNSSLVEAELSVKLLRYLSDRFGYGEKYSVDDYNYHWGEDERGRVHDLDPTQLVDVVLPDLGIQRVIYDERVGDNVLIDQLAPPTYSGWRDDYQAYGYSGTFDNVAALTEQSAKIAMYDRFNDSQAEQYFGSVEKRRSAWLEAGMPIVELSESTVYGYRVPNPLTTHALLEVTPNLHTLNNYVYKFVPGIATKGVMDGVSFTRCSLM